MKFAQDSLGHASALTTLNIYSHAITEHGREYAVTVEVAFPFVSNLLAEVSQEGPNPLTVNLESDGLSLAKMLTGRRIGNLAQRC